MEKDIFVRFLKSEKYMFYILISVLCSVTVAIIIKLARQRGVNYLQLLVWNYPVALLLTYFVLKPQIIPWTSNLPWNLYLPLGFLLPFIFICLALSIRFGGIVKTEVAQRLSLFIPLIAAYFWMNEQFESKKFIGIAVGLLAIVFSIGWSKNNKSEGKNTWIYPLLVFFGMGIIDIIFKQIALHTQISYMSSLWIVFTLALGFALIFLLYLLFIRKETFDKKSLLYGAILGIFNFGNIVFYMKAHKALPDSPSLVFTGMNIGVIAVGAIAGVLLFKEKLSVYNKIGLFLAIISVLLIALL
ncbi:MULTISPECIES: EamA family transporter [Sphingobacterium]|uniref:Membrane protein n=1 Tax=Sphingobacterium cellulitidis TaxID=1768011 RepID=A0A8H9G1R9_9SPHI|nr:MULTISPECIES: EamA family transporter [Sphingobacterium]MBA8988575.1 drug/metabolite transporter (DMT)-like permease [Sphingobacterium soli]WFB62595.1 EamA family transporter [Sphingobacterium sp. WM]GGE33904.1 membrane protein [Sphingobacterium soli]